MARFASHLTPLRMTGGLESKHEYYGNVKSMLPFKLIYSDAYYLPIGEHVFPAEKYKRIHDRLLADRRR